MSRAFLIARGELLLLLRSRSAWAGLLALLLLSAVAAATSWTHAERERSARTAHQTAADQAFAGQPDRHPHRVIHYGTYALRNIEPLAAFDPGVDAFTGTVLFLEGHRQNSATFGAVRESSGLLRFGQLTPAFVLQALAPLLLIFLGFSAVSREWESGSLRQLRVHGVRAREILLGKGLALGGVALAALAPALVALAVSAAAAPGQGAAAGLIALGYLLYLLIWVVAIIAVSALARSSRGALVALVAAWAIAVVLVPRAAAAFAARAEPLPTRVETDQAIGRDLRRLGDSHNPDDPFFAAFRQRTLARYGASRVEDLPINYRGAVSAEGEALTSRLFAEYAGRIADVQRAQAAWLRGAGVLSPMLAVRTTSMAGAGTSLETHLRFLQQAEAYRFDMVQRLNRLHALAVRAEDDAARSKDPEAERRTRVAAANWSAIPDFRFDPPNAGERLRAMLPGLALLALWTVVAFALAIAGARAIREGGR